MPQKTEKLHPRRRAARVLAVLALLSLVTIGAIVCHLFFEGALREETTLRIPELTGKPLADVTSLLGKGFRIEEIERYDDAPVGTILAQSPAGGCERKYRRGETVLLTLYVSCGREMRTVPSVVGLPVEQAEAELLSLGFAVTRTERHDDAPVGTVTAQSISPTTELARGETIDLTVSLGAAVQTVTVPDLTGMTRTRAESLLGALGLRVKKVRYRPSDADEGLVLAVKPQAGTVLPFGAEVTLSVSRKEAENTTSETQESKSSSPRDRGDPSLPFESEPSEAPFDRETEKHEAPENEIDRMLDRLFEGFQYNFSHN